MKEGNSSHEQNRTEQNRRAGSRGCGCAHGSVNYLERSIQNIYGKHNSHQTPLFTRKRADLVNILWWELKLVKSNPHPHQTPHSPDTVDWHPSMCHLPICHPHRLMKSVAFMTKLNTHIKQMHLDDFPTELNATLTIQITSIIIRVSKWSIGDSIQFPCPKYKHQINYDESTNMDNSIRVTT